MSTPLNSRRSDLLTQRWIPNALLVAGLLATATAWHAASTWIDREEDRMLGVDAVTLGAALDRRVGRYTDVLRGLRGLFHASGDTSRRAFADYVASLDLRRVFPGIAAVQFAPWVASDQLAEFEQRVRADTSVNPAGYPNFSVHPAGVRQHYLPVLYNEPMAANERAFGHDQNEEATRREVMQRARDTGEPAASAPIDLIQDEQKQPAVVLRSAVYEGGRSGDSIDARRAAYAGQLSAVIRVADVLDLRAFPRILGGERRLVLRDRGLKHAIGTHAEGALILDTARAVIQQQPSAAFFAKHRTASNQFAVGGRVWEIELHRSALAPWAQPLPLIILGGGILTTLLLYALLRMYARRNDDAVRVARETTAALAATEQRYQNVVESLVEAVYQTDVRGRWVLLNPAWALISGHAVTDSIGRSFLEVMHPADRSVNRAAMGRLLSGQQAFTQHIVRLVHRDGSLRWIEIQCRLMRDAEGRMTGTMGTLNDVTERIRARIALESALGEKEVLLKEVYHRVKNNLQITSSLINLQARAVADVAARRTLRESANRINAMALVHEKLYQSANVGEVSARDYFAALAQELRQALQVESNTIEMIVDCDDLVLDLNAAVPSGLIVNELVSNAYKHAFSNGQDGVITVSYKRDRDGNPVLAVTDSGIGLPTSIDPQSTTSLGLQLVVALAAQIGGDLVVDRSRGTHYSITIREGAPDAQPVEERPPREARVA